MLEQEIKFYDEHLDEWLEKFSGRFVLVKGKKLIGVYNTIDEALAVGAMNFGLDSFLVRQVEAEQPVIYLPALTFGLLHANSTRPATSDPGESA